MKNLDKYLLLLFLIANITSEYRILAQISMVLFYCVLVISVPFVLRANSFSVTSRRKFPELTAFIVIYLVAQFVLQTDLWTAQNILYTIAKCACFSIMMLCISNNFDFYFKETMDIFPFIITGLILVGWVYNRVDPLGMICFGFVNRNVACTIATAALAGFVFRNERMTKIDLLCTTFLFITIIYGGSRNALAMCILIILVRYGISFKVVLVGIFSLVIITFVMPYFGFEVTAFDRLLGTLNGTVEIDREDERDAALQMIAARPWTGWGYSYANLSSIGLDMNAHNGYLTTIENLGYPCGLTFLFCIFWGTIKRLKLYFIKNKYINYHLAIVISTLFGTNQEDYLIGVNQCTTNLFFLSFAVLGMYMYKQKYESYSLN